MLHTYLYQYDHTLPHVKPRRIPPASSMEDEGLLTLDRAYGEYAVPGKERRTRKRTRWMVIRLVRVQ